MKHMWLGFNVLMISVVHENLADIKKSIICMTVHVFFWFIRYHLVAVTQNVYQRRYKY